MKEVIKAVRERMKESGIAYSFLRKKGKAVYPYYVGELVETGGGDESGISEYDFILNGFDRCSDGKADEMRLIDTAESIRKAFPQECGFMKTVKNGGLLIYYDTMIPDISDNTDTELSRNQITLKVKRWKG